MIPILIGMLLVLVFAPKSASATKSDRLSCIFIGGCFGAFASFVIGTSAHTAIVKQFHYKLTGIQFNQNVASAYYLDENQHIQNVTKGVCELKLGDANTLDISVSEPVDKKLWLWGFSLTHASELTTSTITIDREQMENMIHPSLRKHEKLVDKEWNDLSDSDKEQLLGDLNTRYER